MNKNTFNIGSITIRFTDEEMKSKELNTAYYLEKFVIDRMKDAIKQIERTQIERFTGIKEKCQE